MSLVADSLAYPWRDAGWLMIGMGGVLVIVTVLAGWIGGVLVGGYLAAHYFQVIETTISGKREQPHWPSVGHGWWDTMVVPAMQVLGVHLISGAGFLAVAFWPRSLGNEAPAWVEWLALGLDCLYFPLAMIAVAITGNLTLALPHHILPAIMRGGLDYAGGVALLFAVLKSAEMLIAAVVKIPWAGVFLTGCMCMFVLLFHGRYSGLLYLRCRERVGWT